MFWNKITNLQTMNEHLIKESVIGYGDNCVVYSAFMMNEDKKIQCSLKKINLHPEFYSEQIHRLQLECDSIYFLTAEAIHMKNIIHPTEIYFHFAHNSDEEKCYYIGMDAISDFGDTVKAQTQHFEQKLKTMTQQLVDMSAENDKLQYELAEVNRKYQALIQSSQKSDEKSLPITKDKTKLEEIYEKNSKSWSWQSHTEKSCAIKLNSTFDPQLKSSTYFSWAWDSNMFDYDEDFKYGFKYFSKKDGSNPCFKTEQMENAVSLMKKLAEETNKSDSICLTILHSNQWNFEKSLNDILN